MTTIFRIASITADLITPTSWDDFAHHIREHIAAASENGAQLVLLPEYITTPLALLHKDIAVPEALPLYTKHFHTLCAELSQTYNIIIAAGTHLEHDTDGIKNRCNLFKNGELIGYQDKIHMTPWERTHWQLSPGNDITLFDLGQYKACVLICYDSEFPELARIARAKGADLLLVPSATDDANGVARIRLCSAARAIENQLFVAISHILGTIPLVGMRYNVGNSVILSPCDSPFNAGGILNESPMSLPAITIADLNLDALYYSRTHGSVKTWQDRRPECYNKA